MIQIKRLSKNECEITHAGRRFASLYHSPKGWYFKPEKADSAFCHETLKAIAESLDELNPEIR